MIHHYLKLVKFSHTLFSLPFAMVGFFLAVEATEKPLSWRLLLLVVLAVVFARNAAMAFNRYTDRNYDQDNPRTAMREIPAGIVKPGRVLLFAVINSLLLMVTSWFINPLCFALSPVALAVILGYSYTKRFTPLSHLILGMGLSLAPLGAWLAVTAQFNLLPVLIALTVLFWVAGFDIIYSLQDERFDRSSGLFSIPAALGVKNALLVSSMLHLLCFAFLIGVSAFAGFSSVGWIGSALFGALLLYQHLIVSPGNTRRINLAFFTTNGVASLLWALFVMADIYCSS